MTEATNTKLMDTERGGENTQYVYSFLFSSSFFPSSFISLSPLIPFSLLNFRVSRSPATIAIGMTMEIGSGDG